MTRITPCYHLYPKDPQENLRWRIKCRRRAIDDKRFRYALYDACMMDPLFFMGFACWSLEPRAKQKIRPFIPWPHQESVFVAMDKAIDDSAAEERCIDVLLDKSRAQGGTFGYLWLLLRRWLRDPMFSAGYVTRNEKLVDSPTDADTLFWKLAWGIDRLPYWLKPKGFDMKKHRSLSSHSILNPENGATHVGYAAGQDVGAGGRKSVFVCDEFGAKDFIAGGKDEAVMEALHDVAHCIFLVSARYADAGVFNRACEDPDHSGLHLVLDWKDNPIHGKHAYVVGSDGVARARKPEEQQAVDAYHRTHMDLRKRLERRGFKYEGVVRSPWYDMRCLRDTATPRLIASQLDRDPRGAVGKVFATDLLDRVKREHCQPPVWRGTPVFDSESAALVGLLSRDDGPLKLWFRPGPDNSCPLGPFTVGCDIAIGSDGAFASNSVASGIDDRTGEQIMEFAVRGVPSIKFARQVVGLCLWLRNAYLGWEDSGMVAPFAKEILEVLYYGNVYYREVAAIGLKRKTRKAGWWNGRDEHKADLFEKMALAMETNQYTVRSEELVRECGEYEWDDGKIIHQPTKNHGNTEKAHGDRCFIEGTMVLTDTGEVPIEHIAVGDLVWTRDGLRPVLACGETGIESVFLATLSNGRTITGTGNHPVWTENRAWVFLQSLQESDRLLTWQQHHQKRFTAGCTRAIRPRRRLSSTAGSFIETPMPNREVEESISGAGWGMEPSAKPLSTSRFGSTTTALCQKAIWSTTRTTTRSTTTLTTWNSSRRPSTEKCTKTADICGSTVIQRSTPTRVNTVARSIGHFGRTAPSFAVRSAGHNTARNCGPALSVEKNIALGKGTSPRRVQSNAECVCVMKIERLARPARVYNLSVDGTPEYFAQGILVHNCIAAGVAWLLYLDRQVGTYLDRSVENVETPQYGSFIWREQRELSLASSDSPDFGLRDVLSH